MTSSNTNAMIALCFFIFMMMGLFSPSDIVFINYFQDPRKQDIYLQLEDVRIVQSKFILQTGQCMLCFFLSIQSNIQSL